MKLNLTIENWWRELTLDEQNTLIEMLFNMGGEDFREFGVKIDENDKYVNTKKENK